MHATRSSIRHGAVLTAVTALSVLASMAHAADTRPSVFVDCRTYSTLAGDRGSCQTAAMRTMSFASWRSAQPVRSEPTRSPRQARRQTGRPR